MDNSTILQTLPVWLSYAAVFGVFAIGQRDYRPARRYSDDWDTL